MTYLTTLHVDAPLSIGFTAGIVAGLLAAAIVFVVERGRR